MIRVADTGPLWRITLDRPDKANAVTEAMLAEVAEVAERAAASDVKALILTGACKVFSAGADLEAAKAGLTTSPAWNRASNAIAAAPCLTIAALNGTLAGGSFGMALACDLRIAVPGAKFFYPVLRNGFLPQSADLPRMRALIGPARTSMILLGGQKVQADEALAWGLIDRIAEDPVAEAEAICADALTADPAILAGIKSMISGRG